MNILPKHNCRGHCKLETPPTQWWRPCWLALHDGRYNNSNAVETKTNPIRNPACELLQVNNVIDRRGQSCQHKWIMGCDKFGQCTTGIDKIDNVANCPTCDFYENPTMENPKSFDRVVLINLKRRTDRIESFKQRQISHNWELPNPDIFEAIEGNLVGIPSYYLAGGGAWGCLLSHTRVLEKAVMDKVDSILVLEDDVTWMSDSWEILNQFMKDVPTDWEQLMLGGQLFCDSRQEVIKPGVRRVSNCQRTHAYAIRTKVIPDLLKIWYGCNTHIDHRMGPWQESRKVYAPEKFIFGQSAGKSDISGARNPDKFWIPPSTSQPVIHLTTSKEVVSTLRSRGFHTGFDIDSTTGYDKGLMNAAITKDPIRSSLIRKWLDAVLWESASMEKSIVTLWHPDITVDELRSIHSGKIIEVIGNTVEECLSQVEGIIERHNYANTHIVHLTTNRQVAEAVQKLGFHIGNWRCQDSGHDHGLRKIASLPHNPFKSDLLKNWIDVISSEALLMDNGVPTVWHPLISSNDIRSVCSGRKVIEIEAKSVKEVIQKFREGL